MSGFCQAFFYLCGSRVSSHASLLPPTQPVSVGRFERVLPLLSAIQLISSEKNENSEQVIAFKGNIKDIYIFAVNYLQPLTENLNKNRKHFNWRTLKAFPEWS